MIWFNTSVCVCPVAEYWGIPARVFLAALIAASAAVRLLARALVSAMMSWASAYFAMTIGVLSAACLLEVQMREPGAVPLRLASVTATRGSGTPPIVRFRKLGSTVEKLLLLM